jgi:hypothetical protein
MREMKVFDTEFDGDLFPLVVGDIKWGIKIMPNAVFTPAYF